MQYSIINRSHHSIHYIHMIYLFYNWKFVLFDYLPPFCPTPPHPHLWWWGRIIGFGSCPLRTWCCWGDKADNTLR